MADKFNIKKVLWLNGFRDLPQAYYPLNVPGVTTILNQIPDPDYDKFVKDVGEERAKQISETAMQQGTAMHAFIENFVKEIAKHKDPGLALSNTQTLTPPMLLEENITTDNINIGRDLFFNFYYSDYSNCFTDLIGTEVKIHSPSLFFRGKIDVFYNEKGMGRAITDYKKSSKMIDKGSVKELKYKLQLGAYSLAMQEMLVEKNIAINRASILVMLSKSTLVQEVRCDGDELKFYENEFKTLCKKYHIDNGQGFLFDDEKQ